MAGIDWQSFCKHDDEQICGFFGPYRFLSNYHIATVQMSGRQYKSTEHAYHAAKCVDDEARIPFQDFGLSCASAKALGRHVQLRPNWEQIKYGVMLQLTIDKYIRHPELHTLLMETGNRYLEETNNWGDAYWGFDTKKGGQNRLGEILMRIRTLLQPPNDPPTSVKLDRLLNKNFGEF